MKLAKDLETGDYVAIKILEKEAIIKQGMAEQINKEISSFPSLPLWPLGRVILSMACASFVWCAFFCGALRVLLRAVFTPCVTNFGCVLLPKYGCYIP